MQGTKVERGWDLDVDGVGRAHSHTLTGADHAIRELLHERVGGEPSSFTYRLTPATGVVDVPAALAYARRGTRGMLTALRRDGRPQQGNVSFSCDQVGTITIAAAEGRAKVNNLRRDPRATLYITHELYSYVAIDGLADVGADARDQGDAVVDEFLAHDRIVAGEPEDLSSFREAIARERRLLIRIRPHHSYGLL